MSTIPLILVRHAPAVARHPAQRDADRALTPAGRRRLQQIAPGLKYQVPEVTQIITSPYLRTMQTAEFLGKAYAVPVIPLAALAPGQTVETLGKALTAHAAQQSVMLVGHEPELSQFASWLLLGMPLTWFKFKKAGALGLCLHEGYTPACATLHWLATPALLRQLGRKRAFPYQE